jgi:hypothetical protein
LAQHNLEAQTLGAQLHLIGTMCLGAAAFVLDGQDLFTALNLMEFDYIGDTGDAQLQMEQGHRSHSTHSLSSLNLRLIAALV